MKQRFSAALNFESKKKPISFLEQHDLAVKIFEAVNVHLGQQGLLLRQSTIVDATITQAPSSTRKREKQRDPEMH